MTFAEKVRKAREDKNINRSELARRIDVTRTMVDRIEEGTKVPGLGLAKQIAEELDVSLDYLVGLEKK